MSTDQAGAELDDPTPPPMPVGVHAGRNTWTAGNLAAADADTWRARLAGMLVDLADQICADTADLVDHQPQPMTVSVHVGGNMWHAGVLAAHADPGRWRAELADMVREVAAQLRGETQEPTPA